ncbi:MAG: hypothetical protein FIA95_01085 [Gemmatimonadetes bacterium]|nr:hypothetical protein [Gemmatimonadota bacterium]
MTSESLSQNEIDLLFGGGGAAAPMPIPARARSQDLQVYDFRRPARISKDRKRSLMAMYGLLAKSIEGWLTGRVRDPVELVLQSVEQLTFGEFMLALPSPCASYVCDVGSTGQQGVIDFGHEFAFFLVDRMLGGVGSHVMPERTLSAIEQQVVRIVADRVSLQLREAWKDHVRLELEVSGFESIPEMLQVANREDPVLVANIGVSMGSLNSLLLLCLPFTTVEKFFTGTSARRSVAGHGTAEERASERRHLEGALRTAKLTVGARLPEFEVALSELLVLGPGSVLRTGIAPGTDIDVLVAGQRRFVGTPGRVGKQVVERLTEAVRPEPDELIRPRREAGI